MEVRVFDNVTKQRIDKALIEGMVKRGALPESALTMAVDAVRQGIAVEFAKMAVQNVEHWKYRPARKNLKPVATVLTMPVIFLDGPGHP